MGLHFELVGVFGPFADGPIGKSSLLFFADTVFEEVVPKPITAAVEDTGVSGPKKLVLFEVAKFDDPKSVPKSNEVLVELPFDLEPNASAFSAVPNALSLAIENLAPKFSVLPDVENGSLSAPDEFMFPLTFVEELLPKLKGSFAPKSKGFFVLSFCAADVVVPKTFASIEKFCSKSCTELLAVAKPSLSKDITESYVPDDEADLVF